jgi:hypothetical protein
MTEQIYNPFRCSTSTGYILRAGKSLPSQGNRAPWRIYQNYILDYKMLDGMV